jgi:hypothetical protein
MINEPNEEATKSQASRHTSVLGSFNFLICADNAVTERESELVWSENEDSIHESRNNARFARE